MFENIGKKIKNLASIICWIGIIASVIIGLILFNSSVSAGLITIIAGSLISWIGSFFMYGFGEIVESSINTSEKIDILTNLYTINQENNPSRKKDDEIQNLINKYL